LFWESRCELLFQRALGTDETGGDRGESAAVGRRGCRVSDRGRWCALMEGTSTVYTHWEPKRFPRMSKKTKGWREKTYASSPWHSSKTPGS